MISNYYLDICLERDLQRMIMKMMPLMTDLPYNIVLFHNQHHTNHSNIKRISSESLHSGNAKGDAL